MASSVPLFFLRPKLFSPKSAFVQFSGLHFALIYSYSSAFEMQAICSSLKRFTGAMLHRTSALHMFAFDVVCLLP